jgi:hypothetical protein
MSDLKTKVTNQSVEKFIDSISDEQVKKDCWALNKMMKKITKTEPKLWGNHTVGFGTYTYKGASGRTGEWYLTGFAPRKQNISIHIMKGFGDKALMKKLGKHKTGAGCLYIKTLDDVDVKVLEELVSTSYKWLKEKSEK